MSEVVFLDLEDLLLLIRRLGIGPVRDLGLLDAVCARPRSTAFGVDAYPGIYEKAAALLHSLTRSHPLVDGNKRLAWLATVVFLDLNGAPVEMPDDAAFELVMQASHGELEVEDIAGLLSGRQRPDD